MSYLYTYSSEKTPIPELFFKLLIHYDKTDNSPELLQTLTNSEITLPVVFLCILLYKKQKATLVS